MFYNLDSTWEIPCHIVKDDIRIVLWTKSSEKTKTERFTLEPVSFTRVNEELYHLTMGYVKVISNPFELDGDILVNVKLSDESESISSISELKKKKIEYEYSSIDPITRLFIIKGTEECNFYIFKNKAFDKMKFCDMNTAKEYIYVMAKQDDMMPLLNLSTKWRGEQASEKQLAFLSKKLENHNIDDFTPTKGNVSIIFDQLNNKDIFDYIKTLEESEWESVYDPSGDYCS